MRQPLLLAALLASIVSVSARSAGATDRVVVPVGMNVGGALHSGSASGGAIIGAEVSVVQYEASSGWFKTPEEWHGGYVDFLYDGGTGRTRLSIGPEIGNSIFGIDGGFVAAFGGGRLHPGFAVRPMLTLGIIALVVRIGDVPGDSVTGRYEEIGLLLKYPFGE
jgi:hypothetical protein